MGWRLSAGVLYYRKMPGEKSKRQRWGTLLRAVVEVAFIVFLFYSNLLMGEFTRGNRAGKSLWMGMVDVVTPQNLAIGVATAIVGFGVFEWLRKRL